MSVPPGITVRLHEPLDRHTAWRTGGPCAAFIVVNERASLPAAVAWARSEWGSVTLLGAGTRTVVRDGGMTGAVLRLGREFAAIEREGQLLTAGGAAPVPAVVTAALDGGLAGLETELATPGSVGASLVLDEGPTGGWSSVIDRVFYLYRGREREGALEEACRSRTSIVTGVRFCLPLDDGTARRRALEVLRGGPVSPWFERTPTVRPRDELTRVALAGARLRSVVMPAGSPELLVNVGGATAADLSMLHRSALERVEKRRGVKLRGRVRWTGRRT